MNFKLTLEWLISEFQKNEIQYALIGGFALDLYLTPRSTVDLDFLIKKSHISSLKEILKTRDYQLINESENVLQFQHDVSPLGSIDFIIASREKSNKIVNDSNQILIFNESISIKVAKLEDLVGLKLQAIRNDPKRTQDKEDIRNILRSGIDLDLKRIQEYVDFLKVHDFWEDLINGK